MIPNYISTTQLITSRYSKMKSMFNLTKRGGVTCLLVMLIQFNFAQSFNANLAAKLQDTLNYLVNANPNTKGITASVYCPGQGIWEGAAGISHVGAPITSDMVLPLASNSKLFTSVICLMLAEDNLLDLNDPISNYIPNFANVNPAITIRQLLNHTSGVEDMFITAAQIDSINSDPNRFWTPEEVVAWIEPPLTAPGVAHHYSNTNYILAGMVVESATGFSISQLIRDSILVPLNLDSTFFASTESITGTIAHPWKMGVDINNIPRTSLHSAIGPAGCIYSTAKEMAEWYIALMDGQIINANSLSEMTDFLPAPANYGLGISTYSFNSTTEWGHGGITEGGRTRTLYDPCRKVFVCGLGNSNPSGVDGVTVILHKTVIDHIPGCPETLVGPTTVCQGDSSITYTIPNIANTTSYVWTLPGGVTGTSNTNSITVDYGIAAVSGNIEVKGINMYGESATVTLAVTVNPIPAAPSISVLGNSLHSDATNGNQWYLDGVIIPGATFQEYVITLNGEYSVIVTLGGCSSEQSNLISTNLGMNNVVDQDIITVFPNPNNGIFRIKKEIITEGTIYIYNAVGQEIYQSNNLSDEINLTNQPHGAYYLKLVSPNNVYSKQIIRN